MRCPRSWMMPAGLAAALLVAPALPRAEIVEEIVAWVDGDVVTLSEYYEEKQVRGAELAKAFSGQDLERELEQVNQRLLLDIIDRKILLHHAKAIGYDMNKMGETYLKLFMQQQKIGSEEDLRHMAERDGMTVEEIKARLVELHGPRDVIDMEVDNRISVSDQEIEAFYKDNADNFKVAGQVVLREIVILADSTEARDRRRPEAEQIWQRVRAGEDFAELAGEFSESGTKENGGKLGPLRRADLAELLAGPAFSLPVGALSDLMETPYGFHVVRVESREEDRLKPLDEVRPLIRAYLHDRKVGTELEAFMVRARTASEWCIKPKYHALLSIPPPPACDRL